MDMDIDCTDSGSDISVLSDDVATSIEASIPASIEKDPPVCVVCRYGNNKTARFADLKALLQHAQSRVKARDKESRQRRKYHEQLAELLEERLKDSLPTRLGIATGLEAHSKKNALAKSDVEDIKFKRNYDEKRENRSTIDARNQLAANVRQETRVEKSKLLKLQDNMETLQSLHLHHQKLLTELTEKAKEEYVQFEQRMDAIVKQKDTQISENNAKLNDYATKFNRQGAEYTPKEKMEDMKELLHLSAENMRLREEVKNANSEMQKVKEQKLQVRDMLNAMTSQATELKRKHAILTSKASEFEDHLSIKVKPLDDDLEMTVTQLSKLGIKEPCSSKCRNCEAPFLVNREIKQESPRDNDHKDTRRAIILLCGCIDFCVSCVEDMEPTCKNCGGVIVRSLPLGKIFG